MSPFLHFFYFYFFIFFFFVILDIKQSRVTASPNWKWKRNILNPNNYISVYLIYHFDIFSLLCVLFFCARSGAFMGIGNEQFLLVFLLLFYLLLLLLMLMMTFRFPYKRHVVRDWRYGGIDKLVVAGYWRGFFLYTFFILIYSESLCSHLIFIWLRRSSVWNIAARWRTWF